VKKIIIFSGTTEGRMLSDFLSEKQVMHTVCVATEYGNMVMEKTPYASVNVSRLDLDEMTDFIKDNGEIIIDATHPYATKVTENIKLASNKNEASYYRVIRDDIEVGNTDNISFFESVSECAAFLDGEIKTNIMLTTGSKDLLEFTRYQDLIHRLYVRVLPSEESIRLCSEAGIDNSHIIAMQGPFSVQMNEALIREFDIECLVTKSSGKAGGFIEKLDAAEKCGIKALVIGRPNVESGYSLSEIKQILEKMI